MTVGPADSGRVLARTPVAPLPASSPKRPVGINARTSAPPELYLPEVCSFQLPQVCSFRLPLTWGCRRGGRRAGCGGRVGRAAAPHLSRRPVQGAGVISRDAPGHPGAVRTVSDSRHHSGGGHGQWTRGDRDPDARDPGHHRGQTEWRSCSCGGGTSPWRWGSPVGWGTESRRGPMLAATPGRVGEPRRSPLARCSGCRRPPMGHTIRHARHRTADGLTRGR